MSSSPRSTSPSLLLYSLSLLFIRSLLRGPADWKQRDRNDDVLPMAFLEYLSRSHRRRTWKLSVYFTRQGPNRFRV